MIKYNEALSIVLAKAKLLKEELVELNSALSRITAEDIISDINMPPFNKSAVDGFACREQDINEELTIIDTIQAGQFSEKNIRKNTCIKIMTGAPVPSGADKIVMVEHIKAIDDNKIKVLKNQNKDNICILAEDVKKSEVVLKKNTLIKTQHIAILASVGYSKLKVYARPNVAVISTGNELVEPNFKPDTAQIRNSNAPQLMAQLHNISIPAKYYGIAKDTKEHTRQLLEDALKNSDIILLTGGVSMGEFDFVPEVMEQAGTKIHFKEIAIKPGKPTIFGSVNDKYIFGLPGNPVSSFVLFEIIVKPLIYKLMGYDFSPQSIQLPMAEEYSRKRAGRESFIPVQIINNAIYPVEYNGSGHINALGNAYGFINIPIGVEKIKKGEKMNVRQI